ncbi:hypothetical protein DEF23_20135 [Marinitenerispora sediminis]|uniref:HTH arsR-type domain-containing protein n=2 Tax=Marinitenerispora sediminis TaxID=1931232 RepID=A0A368T2N2_9ACTN|nr:hypothetical protein DEF28_22150 [Marinitenerispora sediminis]RCV51595.1 hypothetical protein DEF23_20135 [Marinitenerispora sediminis]RCV55298.1 hypothetical protein DEF24_18115 [Marinitenerispora sediminis]
MIEALFALDFLVRGPGRPRPGGWAQHARTRLAAPPAVLSDLERTVALGAELMPALYDPHAPGRGLAAVGLQDTRRPAEPRAVRPELPRALAALADVHRSAIAPYAESVRRLHQHTRRAFRRLIADHGLAAALEATGDGARWTAGTLTVDDGADREIVLEGQGTTLVPSVFLSRGPRFFSWPDPFSGRLTSVLVFPVCPHGRAPEALVKDDDRVPTPLHRLLGRTRTAILAQLERPKSSRELSEALNVSATTVSEHTSVLRKTGLISTTRAKNTMRHVVTPLGAMILRSPSAPQRTWCAECAHRNPAPLLRTA